MIWIQYFTKQAIIRLLSVKYLGVAEIYIPRIAQNVSMLMIANPRTGVPADKSLNTFGVIHTHVLI